MIATNTTRFHDTISISRTSLSYGVVALMIASLLSYGFLLVFSITHAVTLRGMDAEIGRIEQDTHTLESRSVNITSSLTREYALQQGFVFTYQKVFLQSGEDAVAKR